MIATPMAHHAKRCHLVVDVNTRCLPGRRLAAPTERACVGLAGRPQPTVTRLGECVQHDTLLVASARHLKDR